MTSIQVTKQNILAGKPPYIYSAQLVERGPNHIVIDARFDKDGISMEDIPIKRGDHFIETYYSDRWYNIYEVRSGSEGDLKAWYCNVSYPAEITSVAVTFRDLALDLLVYPDGRQLVLDEDEFATLDVPPEDKEQALAGLQQLKEMFSEKFAKQKSPG
jgi:protein associated with RNAse G/E